MIESQPHRPWWRQPLFHFLVAGLLIFLLDAVRGGVLPASSDEVVITAAQVKRLSSLFEQSRGRPPTESELDAVITEHIREEVYYREALKLGLDDDDAIIRRRLRQKMEFMLMGDLSEPSEETLREYYEQNASRYISEPVYRFEQVYLGNSDENAGSVLQLLEQGTPFSDVGQAINLPRGMTDVEERDVTRIFGEQFSGALAHLEAGQWQGPVSSGFGAHLVRVQSVIPAAQLPFEKAFRRVRNDWTAETRLKMEASAFEQVKSDYEISIERGQEN